MRRFLGGVTAGLAVGVAGLGALSLVTPPDAAGGARVVEARSPATEVPSPAPGASTPSQAPELPSAPVGPDAPAGAAPSVATAEPPGSSEQPATVAAAPPEPDAADAATGPSSAEAVEPLGPQAGAAGPARAERAPETVLEVPLAEPGPAPDTGEEPEAPAEVAMAAAPISPRGEERPVPSRMPQPSASVQADSPPEPLPSEPAPEVVGAVPGADPVEPAEAPAVPSPDAVQSPQPAPEALPSSDPEPRPVIADDVPSAPEIAVVLPAQESAPGAMPEAVASARPQPGAPTPVGSADSLRLVERPADPEAMPGRVTLEGAALPGRDAVRVNRPGLDPAADEATAEPVPESVPGLTPSVERFAAPWEPPAEALPRLAFVLLDDGAMTPEALASLPVPVSVALDPGAPGATDRMTALRRAGLEVLALAVLPPDPRPTDVEVFLSPALQSVPEAVAVLDLGQGGLRGRDATAEMALSRLAREGLGAVLVAGGLGRGAEAAEAAGVPAAEILRDLDGADAAAVERQLDDGARRARQEGEAVLLGRPDPATLEALAAWIGEREAQGLSVAPVSALLRP